MFTKTLLHVALLVVFASAQRPHRGPKVSGPQVQEQFGHQIPRLVTEDQQQQQQVVYQPQPAVQYMQQPIQYVPQPQFQPQPQQMQPIQYVPQPQFQGQQVQYQPVQYQPVQQPQMIPQQPIQYVPFQQPIQQAPAQQPIKYAPVQQAPVTADVVAAPVANTLEETLEDVADVQYSPLVAESAVPAVPKTRSFTPDLDESSIVSSVLKNAPSNALLYNARASSGGNTWPLTLRGRLPSNYTTIRDDSIIRDTFRCDGRDYGYYADVDNDCQIFHVCLPVHKLPYPPTKAGVTPTPPPTVTYTFSFICPKYTAFSQDVLVCAWTKEAVPCGQAAQLYQASNGRFFEPQKTNPSPVPRA